MARTVAVAQSLLEAGFYTAEPMAVPEISQPLVFDTGSVTLWKYLPETSAEAFSFTHFGEIIHNFHHLQHAQVATLPRWNPCAQARHHLTGAAENGTKPAIIHRLAERLDAIETQLATTKSVLGIGVIHADAHLGNILHTAQGPRLIDLDDVCIGPREVDLVPTLVQHRRFGVSANDWNQFCIGYGFDLHDSPLAQPLIHWREITITIWLLQQYGTGKAVDTELALRLETLDDPQLYHWHAR